MTAPDFRLYAVLESLTIAVDNTQSGRVPEADASWREARATAAAMRPRAPLSHALGLLVAAADPSRDRGPDGVPVASALWNALDAASFAVLTAMEGDRRATVRALANAAITAELLPPALCWALRVIRAETCRMAQAAGVTS